MHGHKGVYYVLLFRTESFLGVVLTFLRVRQICELSFISALTVKELP